MTRPGEARAQKCCANRVAAMSVSPTTLDSVSTPAAPHDEGFEVVVGTDGALSVPADELARHGVRPGAHLRLVPDTPWSAPTRSVRGALSDVVDTATLDAFEVSLEEAKTSRIAETERRWV